MDEELYAAVAAKAAERDETVTDVIIRALQAYIRDDRTAPVAPVLLLATSPVYTPVVMLPLDEEPPGKQPCRHPAASVDALNICRECGTEID